MLYHSVSELVGNTPLIELSGLERELGLRCRLLAKLESKNPAGSAKDRIAKNMLDSAEKSGLLQPGGTVIEPTSGNTGIGLAAIGASRGYRIIIIMPDTMSVERQKLMTVYGAELILTPGALGKSRRTEENHTGKHHRRTVHQSRQPGSPLPDHRTGDLERQRRPDRLLRGRDRHRRNDQRHREIP